PRGADVDDLSGDLRCALESLERSRVAKVLETAIQRHSPLEVVESLIRPALEAVGEDWSAGKIALSQVYMSGRICEDILGDLLPAAAQARGASPRCAIAVLSDYHLLGKRIVLSVLRACGYDVHDYGRMEPQALVTRVLADQVDILLISVLMLPAALRVREVRAGLDARGSRTRIVVGGAPFLFDPGLWQEVGADAMGRHAADAEAILRRWAGEGAP
ncbi:MAG TPA: cobalamin-dependent protein, partial [Geothrix sp.]|nr:cobalamin-dependent protein [Geothrix sp.]